MHRNVTAIYRTYPTADLVRRELDALGIPGGRIRVIPDVDEPVGTGGERSNDLYMDALHDLHLPEDDTRTYQHSVRRGDYVVSAEVDEDQVGRVQEIMRRPEEEAYNLDMRDADFRSERLYPHSTGAAPDQSRLGRRDPGYVDPYARTYHRDKRLDDTHPV